MSYKRWVFIAVFLFGIGLAFGLVTPTSIASLISEDIAAIKRFSSFLVPFSLLTMGIILAKNASVLLLGFALSPALCLVPALALVANGWILSFVSAIVVKETSLGYVLAGLFPHGIFELPALILGEAAALSFGAMTILALFKKEKRNLLPSSLNQNLRYLMVALALLLPAAIIETYVTPLILT